MAIEQQHSAARPEGGTGEASGQPAVAEPTQAERTSAAPPDQGADAETQGEAGEHAAPMPSNESIKRILEAALLVAGRPLAIADLEKLFGGGMDTPPRNTLRQALAELDADWRQRCLALQEVASGYRAQVRSEFEPWIARLWDEKPPRYSRALLETLAIIAYRQPITRSEIEEIRGVSVSSQIIRTLTEREWVRVVGQRETPGRPAMYGTTREFLDYFNLKSLDQLPPISDIRDLEGSYPELGFEAEPGGQVRASASDGDAADVTVAGTGPDDSGVASGTNAEGEGTEPDQPEEPAGSTVADPDSRGAVESGATPPADESEEG